MSSMRDLQLLGVQLLESLRLLDLGRAEHLRLSLILLDNAAELQLRWAALGELQRDEMYDRMRQVLLSDLEQQPDAELPEMLRELAARKPLPGNLRHRIQHFFDEKVRYLTAQKKRLADSTAEALRFLHEYRSRAKHAGHMEESLLRVLCHLLLEVNCLLLESLAPSVRSWASDEEYSILKMEFDIEVGTPNPRLQLAASLRERFDLPIATVVEVLVSELRSRVEAIRGNLHFLTDTLELGPSEEWVLAEAQYYVHKASTPTDRHVPREEFVPSYDLRAVTRLERRIGAINTSASSIDAFRRFAHVVKVLGPIEHDVSSFVSTIEDAIDHQVDIMRGK